MRFDLSTRASPEQVLASPSSVRALDSQPAMTDFTDRRLEIWHKTLDPKVYEVRELGDTWAVAREGSPQVPFWVVVRYDWSDPTVLRWTEVESNHGDSGSGSMRIAPGEDGGSQVHVEWTTHSVRPRDRIAIFLLRHTMNRVIARLWRTRLDRYAQSGQAHGAWSLTRPSIRAQRQGSAQPLTKPRTCTSSRPHAALTATRPRTCAISCVADVYEPSTLVVDARPRPVP